MEIQDAVYGGYAEIRSAAYRVTSAPPIGVSLPREVRASLDEALGHAQRSTIGTPEADKNWGVWLDRVTLAVPKYGTSILAYLTTLSRDSTVSPCFLAAAVNATYQPDDPYRAPYGTGNSMALSPPI